MKLSLDPRMAFAGRRRRRVLGQDQTRYALGALHARLARDSPTLRAAEFRAFSQFGEDGILQWLIQRVAVEHDVFVELGCGDYRESNTRFLLEHDNWQGVAIDANDAHIDYLRETGLAWRHSVDARQAFVTRSNVNELLASASLSGDIGLLSIDLDGVDYWILESLHQIRPRIIVAEYNSVFGPSSTVSVPYSETFDRLAAHWSGQYFGASLAALDALIRGRGYRLVGSNSHGSNAFWVRDDVAEGLTDRQPQTEWVESRFRDSRNEHGQMTYVEAHTERLRLIAELPLVDVLTGDRLRVADLIHEP